MLFFRSLGNGADLVAQPRRLFKAQGLGGLVHAGSELVHQLGVLAFEQQQRALELALILCRLDRERARPQAPLDLVLDARPGAVAKDRV